MKTKILKKNNWNKFPSHERNPMKFILSYFKVEICNKFLDGALPKLRINYRIVTIYIELTKSWSLRPILSCLYKAIFSFYRVDYCSRFKKVLKVGKILLQNIFHSWICISPRKMSSYFPNYDFCTFCKKRSFGFQQKKRKRRLWKKRLSLQFSNTNLKSVATLIFMMRLYLCYITYTGIVVNWFLYEE